MSKDNERKNSAVFKINGKSLTDFENGRVSRKLDQFCSTFEFDCAKALCNEFNIEGQEFCNIFLNGKRALTGVIDKLAPTEDPSSSNVTVSGRCITCDIVDSDLPSPINLTGGVSMETVVRRVMSALNMSGQIVDQMPIDETFSKTDIISAEPDQNAFDFINQYAEKINALVYTDENGHIVIGRAGSSKYKDKLVNIIDGKDNNITGSSGGFDYSQRYYKYTAISQDNTNTSTTAVSTKTVENKGYAYDNEIRKTRFLTIKTENPCTSAQCAKVATFEANVRRANSLNYSCSTFGFTTNSGELWLPNRLVHVIDEDCGVNSELLIKGCDYDLNDGTVSMEFGLVDAYTMQAELDELNSRTHVTKPAKKKKKKKGRKKKKKEAEDTSPVNIDFGGDY